MGDRKQRPTSGSGEAVPASRHPYIVRAHDACAAAYHVAKRAEDWEIADVLFAAMHAMFARMYPTTPKRRGPTPQLV